MALREIVTLPAPVLRRKARKVTDFGPELQTLIDDMIETMREAPGVGLAAPQVDAPLRLIVVEYGDDEDENIPPKLYTLINPEITRFSSDSEVGTEGCLSIPGFAGDVERPLGVTVKGLNRRGQPIKIKAEGWLARIFQHEMDHLDGVLFIDRAEKVWKHEGQTSQAAVSE
ncbi:MAG: def [Chloroflexi bacterium]|nr:def [Chloroflexota bacterium]